MRNERFARHRLIDWFSQDRVSSTSCAIIGTGAVGNEVLKCLTLLGVKLIDVYDLDKVEEHNLTRSVFFRDSDIGLSKADVAAKRALQLNPDTRVNAINGDIRDTLSLTQLSYYDMAFSCVDNFEARIYLNQMCRILGIPLTNIGIDSRFASVELYPFDHGSSSACYECGLPPSVYSRIAERYSCGWLRRVGLVERKIPTTIVTASIAGAMAVSQALRFGSDADGSGSRRRLIDTLSGSTTDAMIPKRDDCPCCGRLKHPILTVTVGNALDRYSSLSSGAAPKSITVRFSEPVIFGVRCSHCGYDDTPQHGLRKARHQDSRLRTCPVCGSDAIVDVRDELTLTELVRDYPSTRIPVGYILVDAAFGTMALDLGSKT